MLNYKTKVKLSNAQNLIAAQMLPALEEGEEIWPTPSDLEQVPVDQLNEIRVSTLRIIQKNSAGSRGDEWGHAFFL